MGEVLENGVYLPDEGERNAYNGLKGNWNTVDTVVAQVQALSSTGLIRKPVDELPTEDIETNVIYMLKATKPNGDVYRIEYMYIDNHWDALGTSETTLDDYYTKAETDDLPAVKSGINATRVSNYDTHLANNDIHVTLANKQSWDGKQNALDTAQTAAVNSGVTAAKVTGYDTHVSDTNAHVTTSDKTAWNGKQDGLSQTQLAAVNSGITEAKRTGYDSHVADTDAHVTTADKAAWNGKQNALTQTQLDNIAAVPDKADSADLATVATTGDYGDLLNAPTIPTVNNAVLTIQKNGADVATFTANASSNVTANLAIPVNTSDLNNDAGFLTQHNPIDNALSATSENALQNKVVKSELDGKAPLVHTHAASDVTSGTFNIARIPNLDASKITSGTIDIARLPKGALERLVKVADQAARYALTTDDVQLGDTVQQLDTGVMYVVTDETKLDSANGYTEFTAGAASSVPWTGVTGKPNDYPPSSHTHTKSQITDFPALATVATSGSYNDLSNIPASFTPASHTHGNITNDGKVGTTANKPLITGTGGVVQAGSFGTAANTFCEGNDSRLSDARTPVAHTHTKSDVTDLFNSANTWSAEQTFSQTIQGNAATASAFDTAKSITLTGAVTGTVSGTNSWKIVTVLKTGSARTGGTVTNPYFKIASWEVAPNKYFGAILQIQNKCYPENVATLIISVRTKSDATFHRGDCLLDNVRGFTSSDFILLYKEVTGSLLCELYYYTTIPFNGIRFSVISEGVGIKADGSLFNTMVVYQDPTGVATLPSDYTNIPTSIITYTQDFIPYSNNTYNLGTSTNKWKTLNGINPGALSLPNGNAQDSSWIGDLTIKDGSNYNLKTFTLNGWITINIPNTAGNLVVVNNGCGQIVTNEANGITGNNCAVFMPVVANVQISILLVLRTGESVKTAIFAPCLGNV